MKISFNAIKTILISATVISMVSCHSTSKKDNFLTITDQQVLPPLLSEVPVVEYSGLGIKYECESMFLKKSVVIQDNEASGNFCIRLIDEASTATMKVKFPAGTYECLVSEKARDTDHSAFYVYLDGIPHRVYPTNPPSAKWELTTRIPIYFYLEEPRTVTVTIMPHSDLEKGSTGMDLDYIQFVKR